MRTFIAVEVPDEVREKVGIYIESLKGLFEDKVKWVLPRNLHFTIKFLGEVRESELDVLKECVEQTAGDFSRFPLGISGVGFFPSERKARVIWLGTDGGGEKLLDVFQELESCLEKYGYDRDDKPFSPHLTIGRVRRNRRIFVPDGLADFKPVSFEAGGISIVKSTLTPKGPVYETLYSSDFGGL